MIFNMVILSLMKMTVRLKEGDSTFESSSFFFALRQGRTDQRIKHGDSIMEQLDKMKVFRYVIIGSSSVKTNMF